MFKKLILTSLISLLGVSTVFAGGSPGLKVRDPILEISQGNVTGYSCINKFGRNTAVASGGTEEIWDGSAAYVFPATALMTSISQTTNQAAMTGENILITGLDSSWEFGTQTATLNASDTTTAVTLTTALIRCFRMEVQADVVTDQDIRVHNVGETQDYAIITAGNNQTNMAIYTVPDGKTAYITNVYATVNPGGGAPTTMDFKLWFSDRKNSYAKQLKHSRGVSGDVDAYGEFYHPFKPYLKATERTDVFITGTTSGAAVDCSAGFGIIVIDN